VLRRAAIQGDLTVGLVRGQETRAQRRLAFALSLFGMTLAQPVLWKISKNREDNQKIDVHDAAGTLVLKRYVRDSLPACRAAA
jgi:hypothetical protein